MKMYVGVTDTDWYNILKALQPEEVNFWKPGGRVPFKALEGGDLFLFKLHSPHNFIVGGGYFLRFSILPTFLAWDAFGVKNGTHSLKELDERVAKYKRRNHMQEAAANIGCIILSNPFFFEKHEWIPVPTDWSSSIVQGKTYSSQMPTGHMLYDQVKERLQSQYIKNVSVVEEEIVCGYGKEQIIHQRLGQGSFRVLVTEAYRRKCAITGEKTLPVLDAAHIKPYAEQGPHSLQNGLLLRTDVHALFDKGYITIDTDCRVNVSKRLNEDFGNGKIYYAHHGEKLLILPENESELPSKKYLEWHNQKVYLG